MRDMNLGGSKNLREDNIEPGMWGQSDEHKNPEMLRGRWRDYCRGLDGRHKYGKRHWMLLQQMKWMGCAPELSDREEQWYRDYEPTVVAELTRQRLELE